MVSYPLRRETLNTVKLYISFTILLPNHWSLGQTVAASKDGQLFKTTSALSLLNQWKRYLKEGQSRE